ncbi:MAG TPA: hypothetical protein VGY90_06385 [Steroidobacteraceae bacterium]|nr:hypothetical protein [Steroidobacteraceae bacterium]
MLAAYISRALLLRTLGDYAFALGTQLRLIVLQTLLGLLSRLTLAQLLDIGFARLGNLSIHVATAFLTTLVLRLSTHAYGEDADKDE